MKITCIKSGGFMGQTKKCNIDFSELNQDEIKAFDAIRNTNLGLNLDVQDGFMYTIEYTYDKLNKTIVIDESIITEDTFKFIQKIDSKL